MAASCGYITGHFLSAKGQGLPFSGPAVFLNIELFNPYRKGRMFLDLCLWSAHKRLQLPRQHLESDNLWPHKYLQWLLLVRASPSGLQEKKDDLKIVF